MDVLVIGAGFSGVYATFKLKKLGFTVKCVERNARAGGVWASNKYLGCKCDVWAQYYSYTGWCEEVNKQWRWKNKYATSDEIQAYIEKVVKVYGIEIEYNTRVVRMEYKDGKWNVFTDNGAVFSSKFVIMATGNLSQPLEVSVPGEDKFNGRVIRSYAWPANVSDFQGREVAIVGTGSTGVQLTPEVAKTCKSLHVFMRTPPYVFPAMDAPLTKEEVAYSCEFERKKRAIHETTGFGCPANLPEPTLTVAEILAEEDGEAKLISSFEERWKQGGIIDTFNLSTDAAFLVGEGNDYLSNLVRQKICDSVWDSNMHEAITPKYRVMAKRLTMSDSFYDALNQENVTVVALDGSSIEGFTENGLAYLGGTEKHFDDVILCTGFDAITGSFTAVDIAGIDGKQLKKVWSECPEAYLGLMTHNFPNLFFVLGPQSPSVLSNNVSQVELQVEWISDLFLYMRLNQHDTVDCNKISQKQWVESNNAIASVTVINPDANEVNSYYRGANVPGGSAQFVLPYAGGCLAYRQKLSEVAESNYAGFDFAKN